jgi:gliding motility-associatede transport system auxiliary component
VALMAGWDRRVAQLFAAGGVLLLLTTLSFVLVDGGLTQRTTFLLFAGLALVIAYGVVAPTALVELVRIRRTRFGQLSLLISAVVIGILVASNVIASRSTQAADFTRSGLYTLSPRSAVVTRQLDADLVVTGFFRPDEQASRRDVQTLLDLYQQQSHHVKVRFVDPDQDPGEALSLGATIAASIVLQYRGRPPIVLNLGSQTEADVTGAILRLVSTRTTTVCWASGDGERDLKDTNQVSGYSSVADLMRTSNYKVQDLLLVQQGVPTTCDILVLLQLSRSLGDSSVKAIQDYLNRGGKLLLAVDPWLDPKVLASANAVIKPYGVTFDGGLIVETDPGHSANDDATIPVVYEYGPSPITKSLVGKYLFLPVVTPITGAPTAPATAVELASSTARSYVIAQQRTNLDKRAVDKAGPFVLMQALEVKHSPGKATRIVLSGSSGLAENRTMPPNADGSNPDLLLASLDWLSGQESLDSIGAKPAAAPPLMLSNRDVRVNQVLTLGVLPLLVIALGTGVFIRRRRRRTSTAAKAAAE